MRDLYQEITDRIIAELSAGTAPWVRPWVQSEPHSGMPYNLSTGRAYRGINTLLLGLQSYPRQAWLTYKQAADMGAYVRKGETGSPIVFYKACTVRDRSSDDSNATKTFPLLKTFTVFNVAQIDGLPAVNAPADAPVASNFPGADALLAQAQIETGGDVACYIPSRDLIRLPAKSAFKSEADFYATALHELTHWTGHASRLDRLRTLARFGSESYAREELIAELGAAFLCGSLGIPGTLQHAAYVGSWIKVLQNDKRAIVTASGAAQKAVDLIRGESFADAAEKLAA
jgi:antirestriction protein ArdC